MMIDAVRIEMSFQATRVKQLETNTETEMQRSFSNVVAFVAGFAAQSLQAEQHLSLGPTNDSAGMAQTVGINRKAVMS